ncbi:sigma-54 interaction domain-containing protein [Desulfoscipio sp. XC116]|uniref:sigma-54 interaction domain-containing protein n=1 Tax=Desulfoscipio sp. XC116 TaxID=3144975 RepID=UPI00325BAE7A
MLSAACTSSDNFPKPDVYFNVKNKRKAGSSTVKKQNFTHGEDAYGLWITDGRGYNIAASKGYETISGLEARDFIGLHMSEMVKQRVLDNSVTLKVLTEKKSLIIPQTILTNKRKLIAYGTPIYDQGGDIIFVVTTVKPDVNLNGLKNNIHTQVYIDGIGKIVSKSSAMQDVLAKASRAACYNSTVIITGESGVGKEVIAKLIHHLSPRGNGPFIKINAGAIPPELFESELFGYKAGAFTGAARGGKKGLAQAAHKGTLFLDEIGELTKSMQVKLLRLLQEREYLPIGALQPEKVNVRFIAATNRNLHKLVDQGKFREDLFYRLNVIPINIPPLRERPEDICSLINHFFQKLNMNFTVEKTFTSDAMSSLVSYNWPGNVRELENLIERLVVFYPNTTVNGSIIQEELGLLNLTPGLDINKSEFTNLPNAVQEFERKLIIKFLSLSNSNSFEDIAKELGIHRTTLIRKLQKYNINI